uniref:Uncharacterized protein n=1 Tax=Schistocephalus solidus TaxID=70667 RepID=A0A0X3Q5F5_SCHSO
MCAWDLLYVSCILPVRVISYPFFSFYEQVIYRIVTFISQEKIKKEGVVFYQTSKQIMITEAIRYITLTAQVQPQGPDTCFANILSHPDTTAVVSANYTSLSVPYMPSGK